MVDRVNQMSLQELRGESFPPRRGQGSLNGTEKMTPTTSSSGL
jgi:hypothetical protein